jgi:alpha-1,2-glucosyltransferase
VSEASFLDYIKTSISLVSVALRNVVPVIVSVVPYLVILAAFGGFVIWNNGVVLGKSCRLGFVDV